MGPELGDFAVVATGGREAALIRWGTDSPVNHAVLYVGDGMLIEAQPGGARLVPVSHYGKRLIWSTGVIIPNEAQRAAIAKAGRALEHTPYGWPDIAAIALAQRRLGAFVDSRTWWVRRLARTDRLICSQLVDLAYLRGGVHLFADGRLPGLVSPGDLYRLIRDGRVAAVK